ncbi:hypothetical protein ABE10_12645 [Bacillus toyonensis]|nr:hypothetical protein [Bacillus toyonensis]
MEVRVFYTIDGRPVEGNNRIPYTDLTYNFGWNEDGKLGLSIRWHRIIAAWKARRKLRPWLHSVAVIDDQGEVRFAGPILSRNWSGLTLKVDAGDGWALWRKRLVMNRLLRTSWRDGEVLIDEDNPAPEWVLQVAGQSLAGIGAALIRESLEFGQLLIDPPGGEAGVHVRTYQCWDFATVYDRLRDLGNVEGGPLIRFPGYLRPADGYLRLRYETDPSPVLWSWVQPAPGQRVQVVSVDEDGESMATEAYGVGGRNEDILLVSRSRSGVLTADGWPVLQVADKSHTTVSLLDTLRGYTDQLVTDGSTLPESYELKVASGYDVRVGDWADLTVQDRYLGDRTVPLIVVSVSRDRTAWQTVHAFPRENDLA